MQTWIQILVSSVSLFFVLLLLIRLLGKRNIARMTPFRFVSYIVTAVIAALLSLNLIANLAFGFIALGVWVLFPLALDYLSLKSKWVHDIVNGKETVLIKHGKIMEENLLQTRLTGEELLRELRSKNAFNLADVEFAVMEDTGDINVFLKSDKTPVSAHDLGKKVAPLAEPQTVILDGNIIKEPLASLGFNTEWLGIQLETIGVSLDNVFIGQVDSSGDLYLDLFDDAVQLPQPKVKEMLYANFEKIQADLTTFALETKNEAAKQMYSAHAATLQQLLEKLKPYLLR
ncbi:hypothetical protein SOV_31020 [Sporomusa ovata DSM 2662]|uniref:YetF C-terminal domain-containing protein n=1 Tax=Sporomusa ovata TaxID=2378 RepID=A0A0U1L1P9_9FIRM|nr:YetF domain-containing protein [Sporomusa ovata]EQB25057.1 hypothetical protein SOV_5c02060 [Sporomusa ovata DSM 2662]CQR73606.1 FIG00517277: hypothetical protein [Sporomusa ovata]